MRLLFLTLLPLTTLFTGCQKYYVNVIREDVSKKNLASVFVGSPDPRKKTPDKGEKLLVEWNLPAKETKRPLTLKLDVLYGNYTSDVKEYPIDYKRGHILFKLLNEEYKEKKGMIAYRAEILTSKKKVLQKWQHVLFVDLIPLEKSTEI